MAKVLLASFDPSHEVPSAQTRPAERVHPVRASAMAEALIDIGNSPAQEAR